MKTVIRISRERKVKDLGSTEPAKHADLTELDAMVPVIQALIPLGLQAFVDLMQAEVAALAGTRYSRTGGQPGVVRWGCQGGSSGRGRRMPASSARSSSV